jgi:hypothetical protein
MDWRTQEKINAIDSALSNSESGLSFSDRYELESHKSDLQRKARESDSFAGSTKVQTPSTPSGEIRIDEIKEGQTVLSWNGIKKEIVARSVLKVTINDSANIYNLSYEGAAEPVRITSNHLVLTQDGWKRVGKLETNKDVLLVYICGKQSLARVASMDSVASREPVYNLQTDGENNFIAAGLIACGHADSNILLEIPNRVAESVANLVAVDESASQPVPV